MSRGRRGSDATECSEDASSLTRHACRVALERRRFYQRGDDASSVCRSANVDSGAEATRLALKPGILARGLRQAPRSSRESRQSSREPNSERLWGGSVCAAGGRRDACRFSNSAETGTRVPRNTQAPLTFSGSRSTAGQVFQVFMASPALLFSYRSYTRSQRSATLAYLERPTEHERPNAPDAGQTPPCTLESVPARRTRITSGRSRSRSRPPTRN